MDDLVKQVADRTGLPEDKARQAVTVVITQLKARLPAPIAAQLDGALGGGGASGTGGVGDIAKGLGGMFGQR